jgi:hypothetical protein
MVKMGVEGPLQKLDYKGRTIIYRLEIAPLGFYTDNLSLRVDVLGYATKEEPKELKPGFFTLSVKKVSKSELPEIEKILKNPKISVRLPGIEPVSEDVADVS